MMYMLYISIMTSIISLFIKHPLSLGLMLLMQTICYTLISGIISLNFWYSYLLFLMMISGMLILFMYMTSIASNNKFKLSKMKIYYTLMLTPLIIILMFTNKNTYLNLINTDTTINLLINNFFNMPMLPLMTMMIMYLLMTLIMSVKIINIKTGPLRQKF